ncbi:MAG: dihydroorotate dehydrogenase [Candidatus Omnitrophota bacterium]|nr:dihydroorotate dehydrogenase [Candidatus Omnitrophota bacterium]MBU1929860.1 dihydroorotate dehydrogenase [Candidatus Omnitrophota bacterium]MBU2034663.1 dihydroorotate dehydrogenase [Candidatus Omnitrophota bacterium]MBU2221995.1 dihydroorotate dehydrogenase [Candidatus Omnitrophota bacterium]MBU2257618.1 dihydroorotate dehydrogenase [Candidatus Omnitrophota bacterium]
MKPKLSVNIGKLKLNNPVMVASGTFGYAEELKDLVILKELGAIVTKTITLNPRRGNPPPRTCETPSGMLNSIGLENPGVENFLKEKLPFLKKSGVPIIISITSESGVEEFVKLARRLDGVKDISAIEINISCPNIRNDTKIPRCQGTRLIAQDPKATHEVVKAVRKATGKTLITKLSPNVTSIAEIAQAAEEAGSDALSLVNTLIGMSVDAGTRKPKIAAITAGLSGPAIRPVALRMCWEVYQKVKIPIIGMGGITDISSALEFFICGATAISVGTANFINPKTATEIISGLKEYLSENKINNMKEIIGDLKL